MEEDINLINKRKSCSPIDNECKRMCIATPDVNILQLSDCTLLKILQFLDATSLYQLSRTCKHLNRVVQDDTLWINVDARAQPNNADKVKFCWSNVSKKTRRLLTAGNLRSKFIISLDTFMGSDSLKNLTVLALEHQCIKYCTLKDFPRTLEELSFKYSYIPRHIHFFRYSDKYMCNLRTLILDHCQWLQAETFVSFCKYPKLEILSLYMCKKITQDDISILSLTGKFGFSSLKVADLRFSGLGDLFLKTFYRNPNIQAIYYQSFSTYSKERFERKLDIIGGAKMEETAYLSDDEDNNDTSKKSMYKRFRSLHMMPYNTQVVKDESMIIINRLIKSLDTKTRPKSVLYRYPYDDCKCGAYDKTSRTYSFREVTEELKTRNTTAKPDLSNSFNNKYDWNVITVIRKVNCETIKEKFCREHKQDRFMYFITPHIADGCCKIVFDSCTLPDWCRIHAKPEYVLHNWLYMREAQTEFEVRMIEHTDKHLHSRVNRRCTSVHTDPEYMTDMSNIIYLTRNDDGTLNHYNTLPSVPMYCTERRTSQETLKCDLIEKIASYISNHSSMSCTNMSTTKDFISTFKKYIKEEDLLTLSEDTEFVHQLHDLIHKLSIIISDNIKHILEYHSVCFDHLKQLLIRAEVLAQKQLLIQFFTNLLHNETDVSDNSPAVGQQTLRHENLNLPGPSGLQSILNSNCLQAEEQHNPTVNETEQDLNQILATWDSDTDDEEEVIQCCTLKSPNYKEDHIKSIRIHVISHEPHFQIITNIKELSLRGYHHVTDRTLTSLKELELDLLDVTGTNVTSAGIQQYLMYNPQCRLIHENVCRCKPHLHF